MSADPIGASPTTASTLRSHSRPSATKRCSAATLGGDARLATFVSTGMEPLAVDL